MGSEPSRTSVSQQDSSRSNRKPNINPRGGNGNGKNKDSVNSRSGPKFPSGLQNFEISHDAHPGTPIGRPVVSGLSSNGSAVRWNMKHRYRHGVPFDISLHSGLIGLIKPIGPNALETYTVKITVSSEGKSDSTRIRIKVTDPNDKDKQIEQKDKQIEQLREEFERKTFPFKVKNYLTIVLFEIENYILKIVI